MLLNVLFLLCCLPVVTVGPACAAMYYVTLKMARKQDDTSVIRSFFHSFRQNLRQGIVLGLLAVALGAVAFADIFIMWNLVQYGLFFQCMLVLLVLVSILYLMTCIYLFPLLAQFNNSIKGHLRSALALSLKHFRYSLMFLLLSALPVAAAFLIPHALEWEIIVFLMIGFAVYAYIFSLFFVVIFKEYMPQEAAEE